MLKKTKALLPILVGALCFIVTPAQADTSGKTKYPVVLVHGLAGFDTALADYFYGVKGALADVGATDVYTPEVSGYNTSEIRGEQLLSYLEELSAVTGEVKFNLIGHSQGGMDSRYVASIRPDLVASVTSVGSPHRGSQTADLIKDSPLEAPVMAIAGAIVKLAAIVTDNNDHESAAMGSMKALNTEDAAIFNAKYPEGLRLGSCKTVPTYNAGSWWWPNWVKDYSVNDGDHKVNGVSYYSWTGTYIPVFNSNILDPADALLGLTYWTIPEANDGVVGRCSTHLGKVIRDDYTMNHADEINGMFGLRGLGSTNPLPLYAAHVKRLASAGL